MSIKVYWDDDAKTIFRADFGAAWTWDDYLSAVELAIQMTSDMPHRFYQILNMIETRSIPREMSANQLLIQRTRPDNDPDDIIATVVIGAPKILEVYEKVFNRIHRLETRYFVHSLEDAYALLEDLKSMQA